MKVRTIEPGTVWNDGSKWVFSVKVDGRAAQWYGRYDSANAAKQAMRETVAFLRRKHGLTL